MKQQLEEIKSRAAAALANAKLPQEIDELRVRFLGKKGELTGILKQMGKLSPEERPVIGQLANEVRAQIEQDLEDKLASLKTAMLNRRLEEGNWTLPSRQTAGDGQPAPPLHRPGRAQGDLPGHGVQRGQRARGGAGLLQLRGTQYPQEPSGPGYPGHLLY